jgi:hypothetical protein
MEDICYSRYDNVPILVEALRIEAEEEAYVEDRLGI